MDFTTAGTIINDAAVELGLLVTRLSDPYASTDQNTAQLVQMLSTLGRGMVSTYRWGQLLQEYTFPTVASTASYALPADFQGPVDGTLWNRTQVRQLNAATPQQWQEMKARTTTSVVNQSFRLWQNRFWIYPVPTAAETIAYEYASLYWASTAPTVAPTLDAPTAESQTVWLDRPTMVAGLRYLFLRGKGMDSTAAQQDFETALGRARTADVGGAPVISLTAAQNSGFLASAANLPDTGWGL